MSGITIRRTVALCTLALGLACVASPAFAQSGQIKGRVSDAQGNAVEGAKVLIENLDNGSKALETKTSKKGEYIQVGLYPGKYRITVSKDALSTTKETDIHLDMLTLDLKLEAAGGGKVTGSKEDIAKARAKAEANTKAFSDGVELSNQGKTDEAIAKFNEVIAAVPSCPECYANIGTNLGQAKKYEEAETAYKKAIELKPDFAEAYNGLANVYNAEKKFDLAAEASAQADKYATAAGSAGGAGASAASLHNQGIIFWNQNKIKEASDKFEAALKVDPNYFEAHYMLGKTYINLGKLAEAAKELQDYVKGAPAGPNKDDAVKTLEMLKPYIK